MRRQWWTRGLIGLAMLALLLTGGAAWGTTILYDPFNDGGRTNGSDPQDTAWYATTASTTMTVPDLGAPHGYVLQYNPGADYRSYVGTFASQTLSQTWDKLTLTFDFRFPTAPTGTGSTIRFGLYNTNGTAASGDSTTADCNDYGYTAWARIAATTNYLYKEVGPGGTTDHIQTQTVITSLNTSTTATNINNTNWHTALLEIAKTAGGLQIIAKVDNTQILSATQTSGLITTFNEVAIGEGVLATSRTFQTDNITVTFVPLPSTLLLLCSGLLGLACLGRRRRRR